MYKYAMFLLLLLSACQSDKPGKSPAITSSAPAPAATNTTAEVPEPPFVQEGVLEFFNKDAADKTIFRAKIEIAHDKEERNQGLMYRKTMGADEGMLFVFDFPEMQSFWMRNTYIPLDILYVNEKFEIVTVIKNIPTLNDDPRPSTRPAQYVIELNAGTADRYDLTPGMHVGWADFVTGQTLGKSSIKPY
jgi:hypothetical protein